MFGPAPTSEDTPCTPWDLPDLCCSCDADEPTTTAAIEQAIADVFVSTCRRFTGCCEVEVRPCPPACGCATGCPACGTYLTIDLWEAFATDRVNELGDVTVDGGTLPVGRFRIDPDQQTRRGRWLVMQTADGNGRWVWPTQRLAIPNGLADTWSIVARIGTAPPADILRATADLACEYIKLCNDPDACNLPDSVSSVTRRGVTMNFADLSDGNTGVPTLNRALEKYGCDANDFEGGWDPMNEWAFVPVARPTLCQ